MNADPLPFVQAAALCPDSPAGPAWLVEGLWIEEGVGMIAGPPKSAKTWLAIDLAISVASGTPCLGRFQVPEPRRVLLYAAEDGAAIVRQRIEAICAHRGVPIERIPLFVITADSIRLDTPTDQARLARTVEGVQPPLLILDPLVRVYGSIDENFVGDVSALLAYLRSLQRASGCAIALVHHARKNGPTSSPGQTLRGSSDFHAWGDVNLYLRRKGQDLQLTIEHRSAASPPPIPLRLADDDPQTVHLEPADLPPAPPPNAAPEALADQILAAIAAASAPVTRAELRKALRARNERIGETLRSLHDQSRIRRVADGWVPAQDP
jgi:hypothetical protein